MTILAQKYLQCPDAQILKLKCEQAQLDEKKSSHLTKLELHV